MANLPHEIIFDILSRFPVKSLLRFRCVCKSWHSLISDDSVFIKNHLHRANASCQRRLLLPTTPFLQSIDFENPPQNNNNNDDGGGDDDDDNARLSSSFLDFIPINASSVTIVGSCDGLVCIVEDYLPENIIVCNPCTRIFRKLPYPNFPSENRFEFYGFGYDYSVDDYKVVRFDNPGRTVEVFSLKSNSWRKVLACYPNVFDLQEGEGGAFVNGALHWIQSSDYCKLEIMIVSFDLATEEFRELVRIRPQHNQYLTVLGGCLSVVFCDSYTTHEILMMKEYGVEASWTKLLIHTDDDNNSLVPKWLAKNGEVLMEVNDARLKMYNLEEMTYSSLDFEDDWNTTSGTYIETLVSPNGNQA